MHSASHSCCHVTYLEYCESVKSGQGSFQFKAEASPKCLEILLFQRNGMEVDAIEC